MGVVIGIDVGGSTTKIVGFKREGEGYSLVHPLFVRATDPITSIYGAFGRFTNENDLDLTDIERVVMTGVGSSYITKPIYSLRCDTVPEFRSIGLGGLYLSGLDFSVIRRPPTATPFLSPFPYTRSSDQAGGPGASRTGGRSDPCCRWPG